jgi:hypothetical protein
MVPHWSFPDEVKKDPKLVQEETALYNSRRENLEQSISGLNWLYNWFSRNSP